MEYKKEQTKLIFRRRNSIRAYKILDIKDGSLIVRNPYKRENATEIEVPKPTDDYKVGDYADIIFLRTGNTGRKIEVVGHTPPEFVPTTRDDIGI